MAYVINTQKQRTAGPPRLTPYGGSSWLSVLTGTRSTMQLWSDSPAGWADAATYNVWAKNCIKAMADALAQVPLKLYKPAAKEGQKPDCVDDHPVLTLLDEINPFYLDQSSFKREGARQLGIYGQWVIYKQRGDSGEGEPTELHILPGLDINLLRDERGYPISYTYRGADQYDPADIIRIYYPSTKDPFIAESPTSTAIASINRYTLADMAQEAIDKNGGRGGGMVSTDFNMIDGDARQFMEQWNAKNRDTQYMADDRFLPPGMDYKSGQLTALEQQREQRALRLMNEVFAAYGVPPAVAGDYSDASKLANADAQLKQFWRGNIVPLAQMVAESFNNYLLWSEYEGSKEQGLRLAFCFDDVDALQEDEVKRAEIDSVKAQTVVTKLQGGIATVNESREEVGLPRIEGNPAADDVTLIVNGGQPSGQPQGDTPPEQATNADGEIINPATASVLTSTQLVNLRGIAESYAAGNLTDRQARIMLKLTAPSISDQDVEDFIAKPTDETINIKDLPAAGQTDAAQPAAGQTDATSSAAAKPNSSGMIQARVIAGQYRKGDIDLEQAQTMIRQTMPDIDDATLEIFLRKPAPQPTEPESNEDDEPMGIDAPTLTALQTVIDNLNVGAISDDQAQAQIELLLPQALPSQVAALLETPTDESEEDAPLDPEDAAQQAEADMIEDELLSALDDVEIARREADDGEDAAEGEMMSGEGNTAAKAGNEKRDQGGKFSSVDGAPIDRKNPRDLNEERRQAIIDRATKNAASKKGKKGKKAKKPKKTDAEKAAEKEKKRQERLNKAVQQRSEIDDALKQLEGNTSDAANAAREKLNKVANMIDKQINRLNNGSPTDQVASALAAAGAAAAGKALLPVIDYVGRAAYDNNGAPLGTIDKVERFGVHGGIEATKAEPVLIVGEKFYKAADVRVMLEG